MLYPAKWKWITVDQSKVLRNRLFRFFWATRYNALDSFDYAVFILLSMIQEIHDYQLVNDGNYEVSWWQKKKKKSTRVFEHFGWQHYKSAER